VWLLMESLATHGDCSCTDRPVSIQEKQRDLECRGDTEQLHMRILHYKEELNCHRDTLDTTHQRTKNHFIVIEDFVNAYTAN
jgi:hypothetical protein